MKNAHAAFLGLLIVALASGCSAARRNAVVVPALTSEADYDGLWAATVDVVSARFEVTKAEKDSGVIETDWLVGPLSMTGFKVNTTRSDAAADSLKTYRRRAYVKIDRLATSPVTVVVYREIMIREHPNVTPGGTFTVIRPSEATEGVRIAWHPDGRDERLEDVIMREITSDYLGTEAARSQHR